MNLPFSRGQEMEADHIGIMLMAQACYDPRVAPQFWRAFGTVLSADESVGSELDFYSTHPSHKKRERRLETLVEDALALQRRASWCFQVKERVQQMLGTGTTDSAFLQRVRSVRQHVAQPPRRRNTVGTVHELENEEILRGLRGEQLKQKQQQATSTVDVDRA
jgi:metalloendopeptidase OMA1, mitochondrial